MTLNNNSAYRLWRLSYRYVTTYNLVGEQKESGLAPSSASYLTLSKSTYSGYSHARFRSGNRIVVCPSSVLLACLSSSPRLSIRKRATPAASRCATASSHSFLAARKHCWLRFRQASSKSCNEFSVHSSRYSSGGNLDIRFPCVLVCRSTWWTAQ